MSGQKGKVLVADDNDSIREMLSMLLEMDGYEVHTAENGAVALNKFNSVGNIDLIVSDMNMPELNGLELISEVRKLDDKVPFIFLTGEGDVYLASEAISRGAEDYIKKNENIHEIFLPMVAKILDQYRSKKA
ncbi:MAG: response regulator [Nitrospirae bacterium]|nr:MAG: response regulator [Nitrospirota bacterium]